MKEYLCSACSIGAACVVVASLAIAAPLENPRNAAPRDSADNPTSNQAARRGHAGSLVDLGEFLPVDLNERGQIVGTVDRAGGGHAFLWERGTLTDLGVLGGPPYSHYSEGTAINNKGQVVGRTTLDGANAEVQADGFIWERGTMATLGTGEAGYVPAYSYPFAINERGQVVGQSKVDDGNECAGWDRCFLWQDGATVDLGTLGGCYCSVAAARKPLNDRGQVVGRSGAGHAFLWERRHMTDLGTLEGSYGGSGSSASAINQRGQVVGISGVPLENTDPYVPENGPTDVFFWASGTMLDLGVRGPCVPFDVNDFFCHYTQPTVTDINERGQVVGTDGWGHGFLWDNGVVTDLGASFHPSAINNQGQIVGGGQLWENGTLTDFGLPTLCSEPYCYGPIASDINERGQVTGLYPFEIVEHGVARYHGFLWAKVARASHE